MTKKDLRKLFLAERLAVSADEIEHHSAKIAERFMMAIPVQSFAHVAVYMPISTKNEVNTGLFVERMNRDFAFCKFYLPFVLENKMHMAPYSKELEKSQLGILEPTAKTIADPKKLDAVIVPLLSFDKNGHRLGYGGGYYDRYLPTLRPDCLKVGFSILEVSTEPFNPESHDIPLDIVVTPTKVWTFPR